MFNQYLNLISDIKIELSKFIIISLIISLLEFINVTIFFPLIQIYFEGDQNNLSNISKYLLKYLDYNILIFFIPLIIVIQALIASINETWFVKNLANWRIKKSLYYLESIWKTSFYNQKNIKNGQIEVVISRNLGFSVKLRHLTAIMISDFIFAVILIFISIYINYLTSFLFFIVGLIFFFISKSTLKFRQKNTQLVKQGFNDTANLTSQIYQDYRTINFYPFQNWKNFFNKNISSACLAQYKTDKINIFTKLLSQPVAIIIIFIFGIILINTNLANMKEFLIVSFLFYRGAPKLISSVRMFGEILGEIPIDISKEIMTEEIDNNKYSYNNLSDDLMLKGENIKLSLFENRQIEIPDFNLKLGNILLIKGKSGSGKSTFLDAISGFKEIDQGKIQIIDRKESIKISKNLLINNFSIVRAESNLINGTLKENLNFGESFGDFTYLSQIIKILQIDKFWSQDLKFDTKIQSFGKNLSAGQRQRILIARALSKKPKILILDEPTSNLDKESEKSIIHTINQFRKNFITIIVSHNESFDEYADLIINL